MTFTGRLVRRLRRSAPADLARRAERRFAALLSTSAWDEARITSLPRGYRWLRLGSVGAMRDPLAGYVSRDLTSLPLGAHDCRCDAVLVAAAALGGPDRLGDTLVDAMIECEQRSIPTLFIASTEADLGTPLPSLCRMTLTDRVDLAAELAARIGVRRTVLVHTDADWLPTLARIARAG